MEQIKTYSLYLSYKELMFLDGNCSDKVQAIVNQAKKEASFGLDEFSNEVLRKAVDLGKLTWRSKQISNCTHCDEKPLGYQTFPRNSSTHYKGEINRDKPFSYYGIELFWGFFIFQGCSGICNDCWQNKYLPKIVEYIIKNNLPVEIQKNQIAETQWKRDNVRICYGCKQEMYESEMGECRTFTGNGTYKGICPHCKAESALFGGTHETTNKFRMIPVSPTP